jgi:hypothetical protein
MKDTIVAKPFSVKKDKTLGDASSFSIEFSSFIASFVNTAKQFLLTDEGEDNDIDFEIDGSISNLLDSKKKLVVFKVKETKTKRFGVVMHIIIFKNNDNAIIKKQIIVSKKFADFIGEELGETNIEALIRELNRKYSTDFPLPEFVKSF